VAQRSFAVLKPGGRAAFIASAAQAPRPERSDVTALRLLLSAVVGLSSALSSSIGQALFARPRSNFISYLRTPID
jgi:hypothetical protein